MKARKPQLKKNQSRNLRSRSLRELLGTFVVLMLIPILGDGCGGGSSGTGITTASFDVAVAGRLLDFNGQPTEGALVSLEVEADPVEVAKFSLVRTALAQTEVESSVPGRVVLGTTATDREGRFLLRVSVREDQHLFMAIDVNGLISSAPLGMAEAGAAGLDLVLAQDETGQLSVQDMRFITAEEVAAVEAELVQASQDDASAASSQSNQSGSGGGSSGDNDSNDQGSSDQAADQGGDAGQDMGGDGSGGDAGQDMGGDGMSGDSMDDGSDNQGAGAGDSGDDSNSDFGQDDDDAGQNNDDDSGSDEP